jgi:peptidoglycan-N-acetylglucosamine deacetylase
MNIKTVFYTIVFFNVNLICLAQRKVAITIDDAHTLATPLLTWQQRNEALLQTLDKYNIQAALFICGKRIADSNGNYLLHTWDAKNHLMCNHSYSHFYYNGSISAQSFISDFLAGDSMIKNYRNYTKLFRFPYLKEGNTAGKRDSMRKILQKLKYKNGYVTIDASDWYIDAEMIKALKADSTCNLQPYKEYYIKHILDRANYYDSLSRLVFKKPIPHTLLIHHSLLNALFLDDILIALQKNDWQLINASTAFANKQLKNLQPNIVPCGESIIWQCAALVPALDSTLRYPAEDGVYEEAGLKKMLDEYKK